MLFLLCHTARSNKKHKQLHKKLFQITSILIWGDCFYHFYFNVYSFMGNFENYLSFKSNQKDTLGAEIKSGKTCQEKPKPQALSTIIKLFAAASNQVRLQLKLVEILPVKFWP